MIVTKLWCVLLLSLMLPFVSDNPSHPRNFTAIESEIFAEISWEAPSNLGSPEVSYYELIVSDERRDTLYNVTLPASGSREFNATGLLPGTNYTASLRAVSQVSPVLVVSPAAELEFTTNTSGERDQTLYSILPIECLLMCIVS